MKSLLVAQEYCTGCKRCEQACIAAHSRTGDAVRAFLERPPAKTRLFVESAEGPVPLVCRHCEEPLCVSACMAGCMQKDSVTGVVDNKGHEQQCVGCWMCIMACPYGVIVPEFDVAQTAATPFNTAVKCDLCAGRDVPACVEACPMSVLDLGEMAP